MRRDSREEYEKRKMERKERWRVEEDGGERRGLK